MVEATASVTAVIVNLPTWRLVRAAADLAADDPGWSADLPSHPFWWPDGPDAEAARSTGWESIEEEGPVERIVQSYRFGPHRVDVVEHPDDDGGGFALVVVDGTLITEAPLGETPTLEDVVRVYARWRERAEAT